MKIPLQVINTYKYKRTVPSCSFVFLCICTFSTVTQSYVKALTQSCVKALIPRCSFIRGRALKDETVESRFKNSHVLST